MNAQPQTIASDIFAKLDKFQDEVSVPPLVIARQKQEAEKLFKTSDPYLAYVLLGSLAVFDEKLSEDERFISLKSNIEKAKKLPHDKRTVLTNYCDGLSRLGKYELTYGLLEDLVEIAKDDIRLLSLCYDCSSSRGLIALATETLCKLERLGCDVSSKQIELECLNNIIKETHLRPLLNLAVSCMRGYGLIKIAALYEYDELDKSIYLDLFVPHKSDASRVAECDVELSRLKVRYARENNINLNKFIIGCRLKETN